MALYLSSSLILTIILSLRTYPSQLIDKQNFKYILFIYRSPRTFAFNGIILCLHHVFLEIFCGFPKYVGRSIKIQT